MRTGMSKGIRAIIISVLLVVLIVVGVLIVLSVSRIGKVDATFVRYEDERTVTIMLVNRSRFEIEYWGSDGWSVVNATSSPPSLKRGATTEIRLSYPSSTLPTATT